MLNDPVNEVPDLIFDSINEKGIQKATRRTRGIAGPSKLFGDNTLGKHNIKLCQSLVDMEVYFVQNIYQTVGVLVCQ